MRQEWRRLKRPSGLRSQRCVGTTASRCRMRPSTKLGLRPPLPSGEQIVYTTLLPFVRLAPLTLKLKLPPRRQILARRARLRSFLLLAVHPRRPSNLRLLKKKLTQPGKWPMMLPSLQLPLRASSRSKRLPTLWSSSWQLCLCLPRRTSKVKAQRLQQQPLPTRQGLSKRQDCT